MFMKFNELFDSYPCPFFVIEPIYNEKNEMVNFKYRFLNEAFARFLGKSKKELLFNDFVSVFGPKYEMDWMIFFDKVIKTNGFLAETRFSSVISRTIVIESFCVKPNLCANFIRDYYTNPEGYAVSDNRPNLDILRKAYIDYMTNFYNENYLKENKALIESSKNIGLIFLDINNLRKVNNEQGHRAGDHLILEFVKEVRKAFEGNDYFRIGGDEFLVIVMGPNKTKFEDHCNKIQAEFDEKDLASLGFKFYESVPDLHTAIKEVAALMQEHRSLIRKKNGKK